MKAILQNKRYIYSNYSGNPEFFIPNFCIFETDDENPVKGNCGTFFCIIILIQFLILSMLATKKTSAKIIYIKMSFPTYFLHKEDATNIFSRGSFRTCMDSAHKMFLKNSTTVLLYTYLHTPC